MKILFAPDQGSGVGEPTPGWTETCGHLIKTIYKPDELVRFLSSDSSFDLMVLDFELPGMSGLKGVATVLPLLGTIPLVSVLGQSSLELARRILKSGAAAVVPRETGIEALAGIAGIAGEGRKMVLFDPPMGSLPPPAVSSLSEREIQVLRGICDGLQNKEIAHSFHIQEVTVKMHVRAIIRKLGARNRTHAAMIAKDLHIAS